MFFGLQAVEALGLPSWGNQSTAAFLSNRNAIDLAIVNHLQRKREWSWILFYKMGEISKHLNAPLMFQWRRNKIILPILT